MANHKLWLKAANFVADLPTFTYTGGSDTTRGYAGGDSFVIDVRLDGFIDLHNTAVSSGPGRVWWKRIELSEYKQIPQILESSWEAAQS